MLRFLQLRASYMLFLLAWGSACHKRQVAVPVAAPPAPVVQTAPATPPVPDTVAKEPETPSITTHPEDPSKYQLNKAPQPVPAAKKAPRPASTPVSTATQQPPVPTTPSAPPVQAAPPPVQAAPPPVQAAPPPKLGDVLSADEQKQLNSSIDQSLAQAQTSLNAIGSRQLSKDQQVEVQRVRDFIRQAKSTRDSDPAGAKSLAERAEVLARDLAATFH
jgi:hypothetical protein